jgi:hypothetical protein
MPKRPFALLLLLCMASGCGEEPNDTDIGGVSADDARALDDAAQKLDSENELKGAR